MKWYQMKEQAAGTLRLLIIWKIYKIFGKKVVEFLVIFITFFAFLGAKEPRKYSKKYLSIIGMNSGLLNQFKHFLALSYSLIDKMEVYAGKFNPDNIFFDNEEDKKIFINDLSKGVFIISSHLGNIEMMRAFLLTSICTNLNIFLSIDQCKIFNNFIKQIEIQSPVTIYPVEDININTSIEIKEKISNGESVVMAGDRISPNSAGNYTQFLGKKIQIPSGTFKFALIMESPIYFICALKEGEKYRIYLKKFECNGKRSNVINQMQNEYIAFLEQLVPKYPFQFFHFYDLFEENQSTGQ